jgi:hypothetical protein
MKMVALRYASIVFANSAVAVATENFDRNLRPKIFTNSAAVAIENFRHCW